MEVGQTHLLFFLLLLLLLLLRLLLPVHQLPIPLPTPLLRQILNPHISRNRTLQPASRPIRRMVLHRDLVEPLHRRDFRGGLFVRSGDGGLVAAGAGAVVAGTGEGGDDAEADEDGEVESVGRVPFGGYERGAGLSICEHSYAK